MWDAKKFARSGDTDKLRHRHARIRDQQSEHDERCPAHAETFADQIGETLASNRAHASAHLLDNAEADCDWNQEPEKGITEIRADRSKRCDATGVIPGVGGNHSRAKNGDEREQALTARD